MIGVAGRAEAPRVQAPFVETAASAAEIVAPVSPLPEALTLSEPVAIEIPSIGVDSAVGEVGLAPDGTIEVPAPGPTYDLAAWYRHSPTPGELGPAIVEGHLDTPDGEPSVFYRLGELAAGAPILIRREDGRVATFTVTEVGRFAKAAFPTAAVYGDLDHPGLRLLTCGGPLDPATGNYRDNVVVFAALTAVAEQDPSPVSPE